MKIEFYEPPMCCPTGLCGPNMDEKLVKLKENIEFLKKKYPGLTIERYMISQRPFKFRENQSVYDLTKAQGHQVLPITTFDGQIIKTQGYPSLEELEQRIGDK